MSWIEAIRGALPYLTLQEGAACARASQATASVVRQTIAAKGVEWGVAEEGEGEVELRAKVRALWSELPLFTLYAPTSIQYQEGGLRGREAAFLALRALPLHDLLGILSQYSYHKVAEQMQHAQKSILAGTHGGDVEKSSLDQALSVARDGLNCDVVSFLLNCRAEHFPSSPFPSMLSYSVGKSVQLTQLLFDRGLLTVKSREEGNTLLHYAASLRSLEVIDFLLARGANPNAKNRRGRTPLSCALCLNHAPLEPRVVAALLQGGAHPNQVYERKFPLLHAMNYQVAELLLLHGAQIEQRDNKGRTALHHFVKQPPLVALLLRWGADPNSVDDEEMTPLHHAVDSFDSFDELEETIELLVDAGARLDQKRRDGRSVFDLSSHSTTLTLLHALSSRPPLQRELQKPLVAQDVESEPVEEGSRSSSPLALRIADLIRLILSYLGVAEWPSLGCVSRATRSATAQLMAQRAREWGIATAQQTQEQQRDALRALWGELPTICCFVPPDAQREAHLVGREALLRRLHGLSFAEVIGLFCGDGYMQECSPHVQHVEASLFAASHSREAEERSLVELGVKRLLELAGLMHHLELVHFLMSYGPLENEAFSIPICTLWIAHDLPITTLLLNRGILKLDDEAYHAGLLLCDAIRASHVALTALLLQKGAAPNRRDPRTEKTPLTLALDESSRSDSPCALLAVLLEAHADPNLADGDGCTPLFYASNPVDIGLLLDFGARVDQRSPYGSTPLHAHMWRGNFGGIALLLQRGADPYAVNTAGKRPIDEATEPELRELLRTAGAILHPEREKESL